MLLAVHVMDLNLAIVLHVQELYIYKIIHVYQHVKTEHLHYYKVICVNFAKIHVVYVQKQHLALVVKVHSLCYKTNVSKIVQMDLLLKIMVQINVEVNV